MAKIVCCDYYGNAISNLTQWDTNRVLKIMNWGYDVAPVIHFTNRLQTWGYKYTSTLENGVVTFEVPNKMLQQTDTALIFIGVPRSGGNGDTDIELETVYKVELPIQKRTKPSDYSASDNSEIIDFAALKSVIETALATARAEYDEKIEGIDDTIESKLAIIKAEYDAEVAELEGMITEAKDEVDEKYNVKSQQLTSQLNNAVAEIKNSIKNGSPQGVITPTNITEYTSGNTHSEGIYLFSGFESGSDYYSYNDHIVWYDPTGATAADKFGEPILLYNATAIGESSISYIMLDANLKMAAVEDNRIFETRAAAETYLTGSYVKSGQILKILEDGKYKVYVVQGNSTNGYTLAGITAGFYTGTELPAVSAGDADVDYYIGSVQDGYTHYRFINGVYVAVGGDSYTKTESYSKTQVDTLLENKYSKNETYSDDEIDEKFMQLADITINNIGVPKDKYRDIPDVTSKEFGALNVGQVFVCVIDEELTYWIKEGDGAYKSIGDTGLKFDSGHIDDEGYLHLTLNDVDIEGFDPFYVGTGGGGGSSAGINLTNVVKPSSIRNGANAVFSFTATETGDQDITVKWYVDNLLIETQPDRASGSSFSFNAKNYLRPSDTSYVKALITSAGGASLTRQWGVTSTAFSLAWGSTISPITLYTANEPVYAVVNVSAQSIAQNDITITVGSYTATKTVVGTKTVTFEIPANKFSTGVNTVSAVMASSADPTDTTDPISYRAVWTPGATTPIVALAKSELSVSQYDTVNIDYLVYDPDHESVTCSIQVGDETPRSITAQRVMQSLPYSPQDYGTKTVTLTYGQVTDTLTLTITQSEYNIGMVTGDNLRYNLDPVGHSNNDADKEDFGKYNNTAMTFSSGFDWQNGGFLSDTDGAAFVVKKGDRVTLPRQIFSDNDGNGKTIDISFKIKNSDVYDAVAMQELNNGGSKGIILRANEGELRLNNTSGQLFRYCEDSRIDLSINVEELNDQRVMTVWLDGIPSLANTYSAGTLVQTENSLVIGSDHCDVWVYALHIYNTSLTLKDMIQNYISLAPTTAQKVERYQVNDIFSGDIISKTALHTARPNLAIVTIAADRLPTGKSNSDYVNATITIQDGTNNLELVNSKYKMQGTSSMAYARSACNLDINFAASGKTYQLSENAIPVDYLNIKVNVASSENANNVCAADNYNTYQPYLVPARDTTGVRDTIEGRPCAVFFTNTSDNTIWASSQQVAPGQTILYAMGDLCNSKKNLAVFGQDGKGEHYAKGCIEVSGNDTDAQQFRATSTYDATNDQWQTTSGGQTSKDYEWRAEPLAADKNDVITAWDNAVAWVVSTNTAAATGNALSNSVTYNGITYTSDTADYRLAKFKAELGDYFAVDSLLYHFLYLEFYAALDNVSKNSFYSYEWDTAKNKYLWNICKNYDDDTILGCDNDGVPLVDYGTDFGDTSGSRSLFNADNNTIWVNIQQGFADELATLYLALRGRNAWDATSIINKWDNYQAVRPHAAMAVDAYNKYILPYKTTNVTVGTEVKGYDNSYLPRLQGSKTYQRRQFLTYQSKYMDGKYGYYSVSNSIKFRANAPAGTTEDLDITAYAKTYVTLIVDNGTTVRHKINKGATVTFENIAVHSNATIYVTPESLIKSVIPINELNNSTFEAAGAFKLQDVTLGSEETSNNAWDANTGLSIPSPILNTLSIRNITNFSQALDLSANVELESVDTRGTQAGMITLPSYAPLKTINLNACSGIKAQNLQDVATFTMASGANLTSIYIENCNSAFNTAMFTYLTAAVNATSTATRRIRMTGINWTLQNTDLLMSIATKWSGYNELGAEISKPVLEGTVYVPVMRQRELEVLANVFTNLELTWDTFVYEHKVTYLDEDRTPILSDGENYVQWIEYGLSAYNPITAEEISTPTKASTEQYDYTFDHWALYYNGQVSGSAYDFSSVVITDITLVAVYTETLRTFTIKFYNFEGDATPIHTIFDVEYGSTVTYDEHTKILYEETTGSPNYVECWMFKQWDKSLGFVKGQYVNGVFVDVINIYGVWEYSKIFKGNGYLLLTDGLGNNKQLKDMSFPEIYSVIANDQVDYNNATYTDNGETKSHNFFQQKDYLDITMGSDFTFSNVKEETLVEVDEEVYLDGTNGYIVTDSDNNPIKLFDENSPSFTMAIDFQYTPDGANYAPEANDTLVSCFSDPDNGNEGFRLYWTSSRPTIQWGDKAQKVAQSQMRDMVVLRHVAGSKDLVVYSFNASASKENCYGNTATKVTLTRTADTETDAPLVFGGYAVKNNGVYEVASSNQGSGIIHWCKVWYDDLGDDIATKLASWTRDHCRMEYFSQTTDNDGSAYSKYASPFILSGTSNTRGNASFIFNNILRYTHVMNTVESNRNGWAGYDANSMYPFCQNRIRYGLPQLLQLLIKQVKVPATAGLQSTTVVNTDSYVYIPSLNEMFGNGGEGRLIPWFPNHVGNASKRLYFRDTIIPSTALTASGIAKFTTAYSADNEPVLQADNKLYHATAAQVAGMIAYDTSKNRDEIVVLADLPTTAGDTSKYYYVGNATDGYDLYRYSNSTGTYSHSGVCEGDIWQNGGNIGYIFLSSDTMKKNNVSVALKASVDGVTYGGWQAASVVWLRSPNTGATFNMGCVNAGGAHAYSISNVPQGVLPCFTI